VLRRNVGKLRGEVEGMRKGQEGGFVEKRVEFLGSWVVPKSYGAFNAVIADERYAPLGLMLMGTLARLQKTIAPLTKDGDVESVIDAMGHGRVKDVDEDLGEAISRKPLEGNVDEEEPKEKAEEVEMEISSAKRKGKRGKQEKARKAVDLGEEQPPSKPPRKKRKKKGDAFDDLFDSLM